MFSLVWRERDPIVLYDDEEKVTMEIGVIIM